jgi:electron transfer flavoprotein alpha subunit
MGNDILIVVEHLRGQLRELSYTLAAAARAAARPGQDRTTAALLGHAVESMASDLGVDLLLYVEHPALEEFTSDAYGRVLASLIEARAPRAVLFGDTTIGADVAGGLSIRLGLPLVSNCLSLREADGQIHYVSKVYAGKILAEGELPAPTALVSMIPGAYRPEQGRTAHPPELERIPAPPLEGLRVRLKGYTEPEAGDIDIELAQELAEALGGTVSGSRPVVDQGWLPSTRLVGKSGKTVKPKLYLALGISGAPEHAEGMSESELIIAVNTDPSAPIFGLARYGAQLDVLELLPVLNQKVREAKAA